MRLYDHKKIESKWQKKWEKEKDFEAREDANAKKFYGLIEFPYPSGEGLHVGHIRSNTAMDIIARKRRAEGYSVLYPIGWDAFGLPTENYALKTGIPPQEVTKKNTGNFRKQLKALGFSFDWSREINTTDPAYYKWTQWIFLKLFEKGLAYKKKMPINWCVDCKIGLANEEVVDGACERCGGKVEMREKEQWMLKITEYADRLDKDLDMVDYLPKIKTQQRNWIGKSDGAEISFQLIAFASQTHAEHTQKAAETGLRNSASSQHGSATLTAVKVFTTRPDTLFGATFLAISPELAKKWIDIGWQAKEEVKKFVAEELTGRTAVSLREEKEKKGVSANIQAVNPANGEEIPVWVVNYVLGTVGTGAIMAVPAHDERDFEFAMRYNLPIRQVILPQKHAERTQNVAEVYTGDGYLVGSGAFTGMKNEEAKDKIIAFVGGKKKTTYKLRDWVFSRQRYWGEPIPLVFCEECKKRAETAKSSQFSEGELLNPGWVAVPEKELPLELPKVKRYEPTDTGESPLASVTKWVHTKCTKCGGKAKRETDVMPNWAGSSWYYIAYCISENLKSEALISKQIQDEKIQKKIKYWLPVDWYNGGMEHTTLHLLYSRFWHKFLFDIGAVPTAEPYVRRTSHGLILAQNGEKMSKSRGNVVNPDKIVEVVGADALRLYEMFMGPFAEPISWNTDNIAGPRRFIERVFALVEKVNEDAPSGAVRFVMHQTTKKVSEDIEALKFNTAVSQMMIFLNALEAETSVSKEAYETLVRLVAPFAPHVAEELWETLGHKKSVHKEAWPAHDESALQEEQMKIAVQVNGKLRASFEAPSGTSEEEVKRLAKLLPNVVKWVQGKNIEKVIYIHGRLVNIVIQ